MSSCIMEEDKTSTMIKLDLLTYLVDNQILSLLLSCVTGYIYLNWEMDRMLAISNYE